MEGRRRRARGIKRRGEGRGARSGRWKGGLQAGWRQEEEEERERWWVGDCTARCNRSVALQVLEELGGIEKEVYSFLLFVRLNFRLIHQSVHFSPPAHCSLLAPSASAFLFISPRLWLAGFHFLFRPRDLHLDEAPPLCIKNLMYLLRPVQCWTN